MADYLTAKEVAGACDVSLRTVRRWVTVFTLVTANRLAGVSLDWFWEGNVQASLVAHLELEGWDITNQADTASREHGIDIVAVRHGKRLSVEVKGFPSTTYARGERAGQPKPTQPASQARQWFSHALLSVMLMRHKQPDAVIALAFPDYPTYRSLVDRTDLSLDLLGVGVFFVQEGGAVEARGGIR